MDAEMFYKIRARSQKKLKKHSTSLHCFNDLEFNYPLIPIQPCWSAWKGIKDKARKTNSQLGKCETSHYRFERFVCLLGAGDLLERYNRVEWRKCLPSLSPFKWIYKTLYLHHLWKLWKRTTISLRGYAEAEMTYCIFNLLMTFLWYPMSAKEEGLDSE